METTQVPVVPGFELGERLGGGASGEVWSAVREQDGGLVAVKVVRAEPEAVEAAAREASVTSRVAAEHVLTVHAVLPLPDGRVALVLPLLRGGDLARLVAARGHLAPGEVVTVLAPLAAALGRLHAAGVVHGDVSPGNVLLDLDGRPVLADLGLGRVVGEAPTAVWGTEGHLAPEVLLGADPSPRSDVYALGALGWLCLSGVAAGAPGLRPRLGELNRAGAGAGGLVELLERCVSPDPDERPDADELAHALFATARPLPLRLVEGEDAVTAVTYRLRAAAGADEEDTPERPARWRRLVPVRPGAVPVPTVRRPSVRLPAVTMPTVRWGRGLIVVALALGLGAGAVGWAAARSGDRETGGAVATPGTADGSPGVRAPVVVADPRLDPAAPSTRAEELLRVLADARARAWSTSDVRHLTGAEVVGGPMHARDAAGVAALAAGGTRYEGIEYTVGEVRLVRAEAERALLSAVVGTGRYTVAGAERATHRSPDPPRAVLVEVVRTRDGWRIADLRAP